MTCEGPEFEAGTPCNPTQTNTIGACPMAGCAFPPGCSWVPGDFLWTSDGTCCQEQCKMTCEGPEFEAGTPCNPTQTNTIGACPMAGCAFPPGCSWVPGDFLWTSDGT